MAHKTGIRGKQRNPLQMAAQNCRLIGHIRTAVSLVARQFAGRIEEVRKGCRRNGPTAPAQGIFHDHGVCLDKVA